MPIITDYAVSFPLLPGPWAGRNSSIDTGNLEVGRRVTQEVPPGVFWRALLHLSQPQFLKFNISLGKDALFGVYIRKGLPPSHAQVGSPASSPDLWESEVFVLQRFRNSTQRLIISVKTVFL